MVRNISLVKGRWHGEAVTEGFRSLSPSLDRSIFATLPLSARACARATFPQGKANSYILSHHS